MQRTQKRKDDGRLSSNAGNFNNGPKSLCVRETPFSIPQRFQKEVQREERKSKNVHEDLRMAVCQPHPTGSMRPALPG